MKQQSTTPATFPLSRLLLSFIYLLLFPLLLILLAGDGCWSEGWIFSAVLCLGSYATLLYLYFADPALLNERFAAPVQKEQKAWDKVLVLLLIFEILVWFVIMPLDAKRFGWTPPFPFWTRATGAVLVVVAFYILFAALKENTFAVPVVRIQKERGHQVVSTGPYAVVRHPLYAGVTLLFISSPLLLSSYLGLALSVALIVTIAVRSVGEEEMLTNELAGYREYMQRVRWRMIPFVF